jgi:hypothetical protein
MFHEDTNPRGSRWISPRDGPRQAFGRTRLGS